MNHPVLPGAPAASSAGTASGQGSGGVWYVVAPSGRSRDSS
jgi:hypothetical protein